MNFQGQSILDSYKFYSSKFKNLTYADKQRMEQYFTAVREVEQSSSLKDVDQETISKS